MRPFGVLDLGYPTEAEASCTTNWVGDFVEADYSSSCPASSIVRLKFNTEAHGDIALNWYDGGLLPDLPDELKDGETIGDGGGGTILPEEIKELQDYGITRIYAPDDGRKLGLQGMINDVLIQSDYCIGESLNGELQSLSVEKPRSIARLITAIENFPEENKEWLAQINQENEKDHLTFSNCTFQCRYICSSSKP